MSHLSEAQILRFLIQLTVLLQLQREIGLWQGRPPDADKSDATVSEVCSAGIEDEILQITVATADQRQLRKLLLQLAGQAKVPIEGIGPAASLILGFGRDIEVVSPPALRRKLAEAASEVAALYRAKRPRASR